MQCPQQNSEILKLPFAEFELYIELLNKRNEKAEADRKKQESAQSGGSPSTNYKGPNFNGLNFKSPKIPKF